jgi:D-alanyl-D-alanine carboxypeptidase
MKTTTVGTDGEVLGLGLQVITLPCGTFVGHSGDTPGYKAAAFTDLEHDRQFVIAVNAVTIDDRVGTDQAVRAYETAATTAGCGLG